ncbi:MAG: exodeoxyribonuclease VII large subunit [Deltaproteobacteria bacterium]|nr:exodeoxyribonuclease VII large subunit [Deltaproteobacteria bacterium]MBW2071710.1 exodeoxyribonuclease VII large subunit [Deltaproteobacteria bacterium]
MTFSDDNSLQLQSTDGRRIYSVSDLTREIRGLLEDHFPFIWVEGEISNFRVPVSGHFYFVLKDAHSQVRAVMFRSQQRGLRFQPEDGMQVICQARVSVYEPRGEYQLLVEAMEPRGVGALQLAYEQLKKRLAAEGLFAEEHKKGLPFLPQRIGVVTSATGAAIRDIIQVVRRRYSNLEIYLYPVRVQGEGSAEEIVEGIAAFNKDFPVDVIIVGRGGGSWEDLWSFNEEKVVRAIYQSTVPIISAVGHEIDTTLADLAADVRAPTPSAAAEMVSQQKEALKQHLETLKQRLQSRFRQSVHLWKERLESRQQRLRHPRTMLVDMRMRLDDNGQRLEAALRRLMVDRQQLVSREAARLVHASPASMISALTMTMRQLEKNLQLFSRQAVASKRQALERSLSRLETLSPLAILARGYSITTTWPAGEIVRSARDVQTDDLVQVRLHEGALRCKVTKTSH